MEAHMFASTLEKILGKAPPESGSRFAQLRHRLATDPAGLSPKEEAEIKALVQTLNISRLDLERDVGILAEHAKLTKFVSEKYRDLDGSPPPMFGELFAPDFTKKLEALEAELGRLRRLQADYGQWNYSQAQANLARRQDHGYQLREARKTLERLESEHRDLIDSHNH